MKKIQSKKHKELQADLIEHPGLFYEDDTAPLMDKKKKKKKIYQLGIEVEDVNVEDFESRG